MTTKQPTKKEIFRALRDRADDMAMELASFRELLDQLEAIPADRPNALEQLIADRASANGRLTDEQVTAFMEAGKRVLDSAEALPDVADLPPLKLTRRFPSWVDREEWGGDRDDDDD